MPIRHAEFGQRIWKANNPEVLDEFCEKLAALDGASYTKRAVSSSAPSPSRA
jgi:hypothetical protein